MKGNIAIILALLGISCFVYVFGWLSPETNSLLKQNNDLIALNLFEEAAQYKIEAKEISRWIIPIATLGCLLLIPINIYIIRAQMKKL
ncbi:MAG: hypothetical protein H8E86_02450 [Planctomycetes bacterium]|nr:hypothetical protein [Planctomycetota bacterium]